MGSHIDSDLRVKLKDYVLRCFCAVKSYLYSTNNRDLVKELKKRMNDAKEIHLDQ